jgi:hypothetical protein
MAGEFAEELGRGLRCVEYDQYVVFDQAGVVE